MITPKHFYMIRHGETEANAAEIMASSLDSPLTDKGRSQAAEAAKIVENLETKPQTIIHSHLSRARETAEIINAALDLPMVEEPDLAEFHAGDWEGVPYEECRALLDEWVDAPNGETCEEFFTRIRRGKNKVLDHHDGPVLIVSHGGVFRAFGRIYGFTPPPKFRNCHLYEFVPALERPHFPWNIWHYDCLESFARSASDIYAGAEEMASKTLKA